MNKRVTIICTCNKTQTIIPEVDIISLHCGCFRYYDMSDVMLMYSYKNFAFNFDYKSKIWLFTSDYEFEIYHASSIIDINKLISIANKMMSIS